MAGSGPERQTRAAWELARAQHGVVTRRQLRALGFSPAAIEHRVRTGRLRPTQRGVYLVGWSGMSDERRWMIAVLACGEEAALSHRSAAALWRIGSELRRRIDVSVRRRCDLSRPGLGIHVRAALPATDFTTRSRIPVTTPIRTLIDLAGELDDNPLERAVNEADKHDLVDPETLREALALRTGEPGVKRLAALLDRHTFRLSDSDLEIYFRPLAAQAGLPVPLTKVWVLDFEVDFHFPDLGLVVETDGLRYHRTPSEQARAVQRDQTHVAAGLRVLRFTHWQIAYEAEYVVGILGRVREVVARVT
jgi:predicted transcriptional regulator of viral defense system